MGEWGVARMSAYRGEALPDVAYVSVTPRQQPSGGGANGGNEGVSPVADASWVLRGITSNDRYVQRDEKNLLARVQPALGRAQATCAALIPIRKSAAWWAMTQDERRAVFEETSHHTRIGMRHLPAIARKLHHCRDLGDEEPFDFLTWFEYAPGDESSFDDLLAELRATAEWQYVEREVDIRLVRQQP